MAGRFVVSLDCEGKWGMADAISPKYDFITERKLERTYARLVAMFAAREIKATFAFVGAFTLPPEDRADFLGRMADPSYEGQPWTRHFRRAEKEGRIDGWFCPAAFDMVAEAGHEIASHGFSHVPFDDPSTLDTDLDNDVALAVAAAAKRSVDLRTFVYPRNRVGRPEILVRHGVLGYRGQLSNGSRLSSLLRELHVLDNAQTYSPGITGALNVIPAGYFLNWQVGLRKLVPMAVSRARWRSILQSAARSDGVAHLWFHPHNLLSGPETEQLLDGILSDVEELRETGDIEVVTMAGLIGTNPLRL